MSARPVPAGLAALAVVVVAAAASAQAEFRAAYERAQRANAVGNRVAAAAAHAEALEAFAVVAPADRQPADLYAAGFSAFYLERYGVAADHLGAALATGYADSGLVGLRLESLLRGDDAESALREAFERRESAPAEVRTFVGGTNGFGQVGLLDEAGRQLRAGERDRALWLFETIAETSGRHALAVANLALAHRFLGDDATSRALYEEALAARPEDEILWNDYGMYFRGIGALDAARQAFHRSLLYEVVRGRGPGTTNMLLLERNDSSKALEHADVAIDLLLAERPDQVLVRRIRLDRLLRTGQKSARPAPDTGRESR